MSQQDQDRRSEDFLEFTTDELVREVMRRSRTAVFCLEIQAPGLAGDQEDDGDNRIGFFHTGDLHARLGLAERMLHGLRRFVFSGGLYGDI